VKVASEENAMSKKRWFLIGLVGVALWVGSILCCLLVIQLGTESFSREELVNSSREAYHFDAEKVLSTRTGMNNIFTQIPFPKRFTDFPGTTVLWKQEEYLKIIDLFMKEVLQENRSTWELKSMGGTRFCNDIGIGLPNFGIDLQKSIILSEFNKRVELDISLSPVTERVIVHRREYAPDEGGYQTINWDDIRIPAEQALLIAEENGGAVVREALNNQCRITISLTAGVQGNDWWIYYEPLNQPSVFEIAIDEKTGKYRILREFEK